MTNKTPARIPFLVAVAVFGAASGGCDQKSGIHVQRASVSPGWSFWGGNLHNTKSADSETKISPTTVGTLTPKWSFNTLGNVSAIPTVKDGRVYIMDAGIPFVGPSKVRVLDAESGQQIWERAVIDYSKSLVNSYARTSPIVVDKLVIFGDNRNQPASLLGIAGAGASMYGVDKDNGELVWKTKLDTHPLSMVTQSPVAYKGRIYVGVSSLEEGAARLGYACCTFRGSMLALDAATGRILWKTYMLPDNFGQTGHYSGAAIWGSSPAIDEQRNVVYIGTGNDYTLPDELEACVEKYRGDPKAQQDNCFIPLDAKDNYAFSVLALDLDTGAIKWVQKLQNFGAWTLACDPSFAPWLPRNFANCRDVDGDDFDFGQAPMLITAHTATGPRDLVVAGQKSGVFWAFDPEQEGTVAWAATVGPGGTLGGMEFGSATDGERIYASITNFEHTPVPLSVGAHAGETTNGGYWSALDAATGKILWQTPDPASRLPLKGLLIHPAWGIGLGDGFFSFAMGPISTANGVVFVGSMDRQGHYYALDAHTGDILWSFASGGSVMSAPAIVDGTIFWGSGYDKGFSNNKFRAFKLAE
jgi:polyvinyl alcohol dehydrogenase (cytochrome)